MDRNEKKRLRERIGEHLDVSGARLTDDEALQLADLVDNYENYRGQSETRTSSYDGWSSDGQYTPAVTPTHKSTDELGNRTYSSYRDEGRALHPELAPGPPLGVSQLSEAGTRLAPCPVASTSPMTSRPARSSRCRTPCSPTPTGSCRPPWRCSRATARRWRGRWPFSAWRSPARRSRCTSAASAWPTRPKASRSSTCGSRRSGATTA